LKKIYYEDKEVELGHLDPMFMECPCDKIRRDLAIRVKFANHCYTEGFDATRHNRDQICLWDAPDRGRVFCPERYELSHNLPEILLGIHTKKVYQTSEQRNYVYAVPLELDSQRYEIYFMLQRALAEDREERRADLRLTVESAYPAAGAATNLPKTCGKIGFVTLSRIARGPSRRGRGSAVSTDPSLREG